MYSPSAGDVATTRALSPSETSPFHPRGSVALPENTVMCDTAFAAASGAEPGSRLSVILPASRPVDDVRDAQLAVERSGRHRGVCESNDGHGAPPVDC